MDVRAHLHLLRTRGQFSQPVVASDSGRRGRLGRNFWIGWGFDRTLYLGHLPISKQAIQGTLKSLLIFAGYNLFFGATIPGIDNSAHIGGLLTGLALGAVLAKHLIAPPEIRDAWRRSVFIAAAVVLVLLFHGSEACEREPATTVIHSFP